jgi:hypothetical protein
MKQPPFLSLARDQLGLRRHINQNTINRIKHPVERQCYLEYVYILSSSLDDMVKIGVSRGHPERRLSGITQCYPDAVLVAYTIRIPYAYRVEQLAHAELYVAWCMHAAGAILTTGNGSRYRLKWPCELCYIERNGLAHNPTIRMGH